MNLISIKDLNVTYHNYDALKKISLDIKKGTFLNIIGPNGSGKTTLIEVLTNIIKPTSGLIEIFTENIGYVPQKLNTKNNFPITVYEVLNLSTSKLSKNKIDYWLKYFDLSVHKFSNISVLSGGQQQRVYIIRALLNNPELLILDEPTSSLDPVFRDSFNSLLRNLQKEHNTTIINVTHDIHGNYFNDSLILEIDQTIKFYGKYDDYLKKVNN